MSAVLAAKVLADPGVVATMTAEEARSVASVLADRLEAVRIQAMRTVHTVAGTPSKYADRLAVTTAEAGEWLGLPEAQVQDLCRRGVIPASKPGGKTYLIRTDAVRELLVRLEDAQRGDRGAVAEHSAPSRRPVARIDALPKNSRRTA